MENQNANTQQNITSEQVVADPVDTGAVPHISQADYDKSAPGITTGVWAIIFALVVPIVGMIMGIVAAIRGFSKPSNPTLGILGIVAVILSIVVGILTVVFLIMLGGQQ
jgi:hypothetical protein